ncbi:MAG: hypothetical protein QOH31_5289 [Verrucomicrobiota bacterium]|jgi:hypothetical protein
MTELEIDRLLEGAPGLSLGLNAGLVLVLVRLA